LDMKKGLICLSLVAMLMFCVPNVAVASTSNDSTTFHNNARHTSDRILIARGSTSNGTLNWNSVTDGIAPLTATHSGIVYIGSWDHNVYALNAKTGAKVWNYTTRGFVESSPTVAYGIG